MSLRFSRRICSSSRANFGHSIVKLQVRPPAPGPVEPQAEQPRRRPLGLLFILGGAVLATWLIKPTYKPPVAAFDPVKRKVCIVFVFGSPTPDDRNLLQSHGFELVKLNGVDDPEKILQPLVRAGKTWLAIEGVPSDITAFEKSVVQCDLALDFNSKRDLSVLNERNTLVNKPLAEILDIKNM